MNDKKRLFRLLIPVILGLLLELGLLVFPAQAGEKTSVPGSSTCQSCHENLYYQFDTGKHYCLTEAAARCIDCHAGDPTALQTGTAHASLIAHPILNGDISRCQACHPQDAEMHVEKFAALAGFSSSVLVAQQLAPVRTVSSGDQNAGSVDLSQLAGLTVILTAISALLVIGLLTNKASQG